MKKGIVDDEILEDFFKDIKINNTTKLKIKIPNRFKSSEENGKNRIYGVMNSEIDIDLLYNEYEYIIFSSIDLRYYNIFLLDKIKINDNNLLTLTLRDYITDELIKSKNYER